MGSAAKLILSCRKNEANLVLSPVKISGELTGMRVVMLEGVDEEVVVKKDSVLVGEDKVGICNNELSNA